MTWLLFVLIMQMKYYAQDTGNQCSILGRLICSSQAVKTFLNPKDSSYLYLFPSLLVKKIAYYLDLCNIVTFLFLTLKLNVLIMQMKYYAQDTGNQCSILGRLIC
jgi:hypothetical protein